MGIRLVKRTSVGGFCGLKGNIPGKEANVVAVCSKLIKLDIVHCQTRTAQPSAQESREL